MNLQSKESVNPHFLFLLLNPNPYILSPLSITCVGTLLYSHHSCINTHPKGREIIKKVIIDTFSVTSTFQSTGSFKKAVFEFLEKHPGISAGTITIQKITKTWYINEGEIRFICRHYMLQQTIIVNSDLKLSNTEIAIKAAQGANLYRDEIDHCRFNFNQNHNTTTGPRLQTYHDWRRANMDTTILQATGAKLKALYVSLSLDNIWSIQIYNSGTIELLIVEPLNNETTQKHLSELGIM